MEIKAALTGNPNCGKTTLFNALTGSKQRVGNWPGVTVEKKEGTYKNDPSILIQDLPGIYSLSPYSLEEVVARSYLVQEHPDVILDVVDTSNLERNLYLTTQLLELDIPVVVGLNMMDIVEDKIDLKKLARWLNAPVVEVSALKKQGLESLMKQVKNESAKKEQKPFLFSRSIEDAIGSIQRLLPETKQTRWYALKVLENDSRILEELSLSKTDQQKITKLREAIENEFDDDIESILTAQRYDFIEKLIQDCVKRKRTKHAMSVSDRIDSIVTNRFLALPIFVLIMYGIYTIAMGSTPFSIGTIGTDWANDVLFGETIPGMMGSVIQYFHINPILASLLKDGIVAGVGATLGFVPQILVLFVFLSILEDCGYMARVAFIMDRLFRKFGLSGKSFIPLLVATGCGVPGIMASRTIEQDRDRKLTIMTTGFIPCGAKMPIIGLFAGAIFGNSSLVATSAFVIGIAAVVVSGIMLKKFKAFAGEPAPFVMELPAYHFPSLSNVLHSTWERGFSFIKRAGTLILLSSIVLWFLQSFGFVNGAFAFVDDNNNSLLALLGRSLAWIFYPLGWVGDMAWKATVATFTGLIAKEEVVNTFGVLYNFGGELSEAGNEIWTLVAADFSAITAYSFMLFNLLCAPCFAAMGAIKREMNNAKWTWISIGYMCVFAYSISLIVYQLGGLLLHEVPFNFFTVVALVLLVGILYLLFRKGYSEDKSNISVKDFSLNKVRS
ncbi:ferrous iron transport protein B [Dubosiella newyorkensis]|uniref:Ferrous iron transport protein B n=2 Tax=Dubosiella newyorkensis TaxID=1862672 RepID=A0A1U7NNN7_9FIRM|nr:ferrous iron transport protein B [Dubosiella newyorkensis]OLU46961.1 ferrous iron transport protein B [Dubosiella newyorkensis]